MIGSTKLLNTLGALVKRSKADATSVFAEAQTRRVLRFAQGRIHQDLVQELLRVSVTARLDHRLGVASTETLDRAGLRRCLDAAIEIARHARASKMIPELPGGYRLLTTQDHVPATAAVSVRRMVETIRRLFHLCQGLGVELAGSSMTAEEERAVANSRGVACYAASTVAGLKLVTMRKALRGFAGGAHPDIRRLDADTLLERALAPCLLRQAPVSVPVGAYEVILEPEAVAELLVWLGYITFGAKQLKERTSAFAGRMGEMVAAPNVTIVDDGTDPSGLRLPFDAEGVAKQRVALIERGRAVGAVYDTTHGALYARASTGHALEPGDTEGPLPMNLFLEPGASSREEMIRRCARGLLIPRFHYVNGLLSPRDTLMTGLTREGACLIEDGKIRAPITTLRFTQSALEALSHVKGISRARERVADPAQDPGCVVAPTVHLAKFRFTGRSEP